MHYLCIQLSGMFVEFVDVLVGVGNKIFVKIVVFGRLL
jgi:hypothetical protein